MKRRIFALVTTLFFVFSTSALAYQNNSYYSGLKIGLENMASPSIYITLNGDYKVNGRSFSRGTSSSISIKQGKLNFKNIRGSEITFTPDRKDSTIRLSVGAKQYNYLGDMTFKISGSKILPINKINVEDYLKGVVGYEMSNSYPMEALKSQAVAARNYALSMVGKHKSRGYDLCDTTDCQVYRGFNSKYKNVIKAVNETKGKVILHSDKLVEGYFAASNGGYTENSKNVWNSNLKYLSAYKDKYDNERWPFGNRVLSASKIESTLKSRGYLARTDKFIRIDLSSIKRYSSGRVSSITIVYKTSSGAQKRKSFSKESARTFLSLPSSMYSVRYNEKNNTYTFSGKGNGHGLGMSQIGAKNRANAGQKYDSILTFYYKNSRITRITDLTLLKKGMKGKDVEKLQRNLAALGCYSGKIDGLFGEQTYRGVANFQRSRGLGADGIAGKRTLNEIDKALSGNNKLPANPDSKLVSRVNNKKLTLNLSRNLKEGLKGNDVRTLQEMLKKLGFYAGSPDGIYGQGTHNAVKKYQRLNGLTGDGIVGLKTAKKIDESLKK